jgi:hypothetical protein
MTRTIHEKKTAAKKSVLKNPHPAQQKHKGDSNLVEIEQEVMEEFRAQENHPKLLNE